MYTVVLEVGAGSGDGSSGGGVGGGDAGGRKVGGAVQDSGRDASEAAVASRVRYAYADWPVSSVTNGEEGFYLPARIFDIPVEQVRAS